MPKRIGMHDHINLIPEWDLNKEEIENPEHLLFNSTICEYTDISGFPIKYYVSKKNLDPLWGEDPNNEYTDPFYTKIIYEPTEEASILDAFGISSDETLQYVQIPLDIFTRDSSNIYSEIIPDNEWNDVELEPKVGDIITTLWNDRDYEIVFARRETNIFSSKKFIWDIILRPYRFSEESETAMEIQYGDDTDFFDMATTDMSWYDDARVAPSGDEPDTKAFGKKTYGDNAWVETSANEQTNKKYHYEDLDDIIFQYTLLADYYDSYLVDDENLFLDDDD